MSYQKTDGAGTAECVHPVEHEAQSDFISATLQPSLFSEEDMPPVGAGLVAAIMPYHPVFTELKQRVCGVQ